MSQKLTSNSHTPSPPPPPPPQTMSASEASDDHFNECAPDHMPMPDFEALARDIQNRASRCVGAPPARRPSIAAAVMAALVPWAHPSTRCARAGAALAVSDREGVIAACRSMTVPWVIKRAERAQQQQGEGGGRRGGGGRGRVGMDAIVGGFGSF